MRPGTPSARSSSPSNGRRARTRRSRSGSSEPSEFTKAEEHLRQAQAMAEEREMRPLIARCHLNLSELHRRAGQHDLAQSHLGTATSMFRDMAMPYWLDLAVGETAR